MYLFSKPFKLHSAMKRWRSWEDWILFSHAAYSFLRAFDFSKSGQLLGSSLASVFDHALTFLSIFCATSFPSPKSLIDSAYLRTAWSYSILSSSILALFYSSSFFPLCSICFFSSAFCWSSSTFCTLRASKTPRLNVLETNRRVRNCSGVSK